MRSICAFRLGCTVYSMETDPLTRRLVTRRLDKHHNDRAAATKEEVEDAVKKADVNKDDFFLFNTNAPIVLKAKMSTAVSNLYPGALTVADSKRLYPYQENNKLLLTNPYGIWSDGTTLWVSDFTDGKIYTYDLSWHQSPVYPDDSTKKYAMGTRNSRKDFKAHDENTDDERLPRPQGIWANGTTTNSTMWVADDRLKKIFAYDYDGEKGTYKRVNTDKDIERHGLENGVPTDPGFNDKDLTGIHGIWSDGETMWVADNEGIRSGDEQKILAYSLTGERYRDPNKDYRMLGDFGNDRPRGIWSDGETMWVAQANENKLYAYDLATKKRADGEEFKFTLHTSNNLPRGIWSDGTTMWVANSDMDSIKDVERIYSYDLTTKSLISSNAFSLDDENIRPSALWSDGTTNM